MIRSVLLSGSGTLVAVIVLMSSATACGGQDSTAAGEEQAPRSRPFATAPFELELGLVIAEMTHQGEGDFGVNLLAVKQEEIDKTPEAFGFSGGQDGEGNAGAAVALSDETGPVTISRAVHVPTSGRFLLAVEADGPWAVELEQPYPSSAPRITYFSGEGNTATPFFRLSSGPKTVTMTNEGGGRDFAFSLLDKNGNSEGISLLDEERGRADSNLPIISAGVNVGEEGIYLFNVQSDGLWTIEITDGGQPVHVAQQRGKNVLGVPFGVVVGALAMVVLVLPALVLGLRGRAIGG